MNELVSLTDLTGVGRLSDAHRLLEHRLFPSEKTVEEKALLSTSFSMHWDSPMSTRDMTEMIM